MASITIEVQNMRNLIREVVTEYLRQSCPSALLNAIADGMKHAEDYMSERDAEFTRAVTGEVRVIARECRTAEDIEYSRPIETEESNDNG